MRFGYVTTLLLTVLLAEEAKPCIYQVGCLHRETQCGIRHGKMVIGKIWGMENGEQSPLVTSPLPSA